MRPADRWLLAISLVVVDLFVFALPLTGLAAAWILLARPPWFRDWVERLYAPDPPTPADA